MQWAETFGILNIFNSKFVTVYQLGHYNDFTTKIYEINTKLIQKSEKNYKNLHP